MYDRKASLSCKNPVGVLWNKPPRGTSAERCKKSELISQKKVNIRETGLGKIFLKGNLRGQAQDAQGKWNYRGRSIPRKKRLDFKKR